ncbi:MAG TPA: PEGA domain-containing protein [Polyangiaceae bacterium]|nr:PEGA domain-containing protein [Polyangiaceae bacterium]
MSASRFVRLFCVVGCWSSVALSAAHAVAEPVKSSTATEAKPDLGEPEAVAKARARLLFDKGVTAYREGRFYDAVDIFLETNRLYPDPKLSFNVGKAFEGMGNQAGALRYYREYLRRLPDAPDAQDVENHVHQLEQALSQKGLQQLTVLSSPDGATVRLDGQAVGVTPWTGESFAGKHRIVVEATGYQRHESVIEIDPHRARDFNIELSKAPDKPDPASIAKSAPAPAEAKVSPFTLATLATGIGLLGGALIAQVASGSNSTGISRTAAFFAGGGTGVTVVGGFMLYFDLSPSKTPKGGVTWNNADLEHGLSR